MLTQNVRVQCIGFHPSERTLERLDDWAEEVHEEAPGHSNVKAIFTRQGKEYTGALRITSRGGDFYIMSRGPNLFSVMRDALKKTRRQLERWKDAHHAHGPRFETPKDQPITA